MLFKLRYDNNVFLKFQLTLHTAEFTPTPSQFMHHLLFVLCLVLQTPLWAAVAVTTEEQAQEATLVVSITEQVSPGDYETLLSALRAHSGRFTRKVALLDNIGGSTAEAMRIGRLLRETGFDTRVTENALCQGSCVYVLAAGIKRQVRGAVAIHRPAHPRGDSYSAKGLALTHNSEAYFQHMGIDRAFYRALLEATPQRPRLLNSAEIRRFNLANLR